MKKNNKKTERVMDTVERRMELLRIICRRRYETIGNLALELGVSERTISRDIEVLSLEAPLITKTGHHVGGVYVLNNYSMSRMYMTAKELSVLNKLYYFVEQQENYILSDEEKVLFKRIITDYTRT